MTRLTGEWLVELRQPDGAKRLSLVTEPGRPTPQIARLDRARAVFDGVLYDRSILSRELGLAPDTPEALLALQGWLRNDQGFLQALRGRFSLVVWNGVGELLAVRDPVGVRPLFYAKTDTGVAVSPYADLLLRQPGVGNEVDRMVIAGQMLMGMPAWPEETAFVSVRRVPAGHLLRVLGGTYEVRRYWRPAPPHGTGRDLSERFTCLLDQAIARCSDGQRAGVFLSGGLDSATVAVATARLARRRAARPPIAVSVFNAPQVSSEEPMQRAVATKLGMPLIGRPSDSVPPDRLLAGALDAAPSSSWPPGPLTNTFDSMAREAVAEGCGVLLTGDGGDEWLQPLMSWCAERLLRLDFAALLSMFHAMPYSFPGMGRRQYAQALLWNWGARPMLRNVGAQALSRWSPARLRRIRGRRMSQAFPAWLLPDPVLRQRLIDWWIERSPVGAPVESHEQEKVALLSASFVSALMEDSFATGRRIGAEMLSPLWDPDLIGFLLGLPEKNLIEGGRAKALLRDYVATDLPFAEDWPSKTFGDPVVEAMLLGGAGDAWDHVGGTPTLSGLELVDAGRLHKALRGQRNASTSVGAAGLWEAMATEAWLRTRIGGMMLG